MVATARDKSVWWRRVVSYAWGYMGTLSALGLLLGVLGIGIYHVFTGDADSVSVRYYSGLLNPSQAVAPSGVGELYAGPEGVTIPHIRFEYGKDGRVNRLVHLNAEGYVTPLPGSRVAEQRVEYDAGGRVTARRNFDAHGHAVADSAGIATREFRYNADGRLISRIFRNAEGQKIVPKMPGYAEERIAYDDKGRPLSVQYLDGNGKPIVNAQGECRISYSYNDDKQEVLRSNYVNDKLTENAGGVATERMRHTGDGLSTHTSWLDAEGKAVAGADANTVSVLAENKPSENLRRTRYCGDDGLMRSNSRIWAEHLVRTTPDGNVVWECFNGADGLPCRNEALGYAERLCEYGADGMLAREYFWDAGGQPSECYEKRHSAHGSAQHVISLHRDGSTELARTR